MQLKIELSEVLVIIPAFNEEGSLSFVLEELTTMFPDINVLVVDDGSTDGTCQIPSTFFIPVLKLPFNLGVGGAMRAGFRFAIKRGYRAVIQLDADGQHLPRYIPQLLDGLSSADLVIGARFSGVGEYSMKGPRKWASVILAKTLSQICKTRLTDVTSGFKAVGPKSLKLFSQDYPVEYLGDTVEALVIANKNKCTIAQIPVEMRERFAGVPSQDGIKAAIYLVRALFAVALGLIRPLNSDREMATR